ncbi:coproporphyrinogen oxidase [Aureococcus anophagefferens]|nr:coproporphyrinogen oxidase [Aureococcus anophagefferens]
MVVLLRALAIARAASALAAPSSLAAPTSRFRAFADGIYDLQDSMIAQATATDPAATWSVEDHAKGRAVVLEGGGLWEKGVDDYFYLPARREHRGVGGVFFDDLDAPWAGDFAVELMRCALADDGPYMPVAARRRGEAWSEAEKQWFNLLYDRGVKFGLSPESVERVLVSSPPLAAWGWRKEPAAGTPEAACLAVLREPRAWVSL